CPCRLPSGSTISSAPAAPPAQIQFKSNRGVFTSLGGTSDGSLSLHYAVVFRGAAGPRRCYGILPSQEAQSNGVIIPVRMGVTVTRETSPGSSRPPSLRCHPL